MNAMMYAVFPWSVKYVMSLCHSWFGVERSNRRGGAFPRRRGFFRGAIIPAPVSSRRTVSGLAFSQNSRRNTWEMRRTPWRGSSRFSATIFSRTGAGIRDGRGFGAWSLSPSSPSWRYRLTQERTAWSETPNSLATSAAASPSSRCSCTARRRTAYG